MTTTDQYTPTTDEIREYVEEGGEPRPWVAPDDETEMRRAAARLAAFDRWLGQHDAKVRAAIADEIEAERLDTGDGIGFEAYINGLIRAEDIAREGRS